MKPPRCHWQDMVQWMHTEKELGHKGPGGCSCWAVWRCETCCKELDVYRWPWTWLWITVRRNDLMDGFYRPKWWMGSIGALRGDYQNQLVFAVVPFNVLVDWAVRFYHWCRYRKPDKFAQELERSYRRGLSDGGRAEAARIRQRISCSEAAPADRRDMLSVVDGSG